MNAIRLPFHDGTVQWVNLDLVIIIYEHHYPTGEVAVTLELVNSRRFYVPVDQTAEVLTKLGMMGMIPKPISG